MKIHGHLWSLYVKKEQRKCLIIGQNYRQLSAIIVFPSRLGGEGARNKVILMALAALAAGRKKNDNCR